MTIKENDHGLDENQTESLLHLGQGCLDCLLELGMALHWISNEIKELNVLRISPGEIPKPWNKGKKILGSIGMGRRTGLRYQAKSHRKYDATFQLQY